MIDLQKVDTGFIQQSGSCVFASYGIVANYFTNIAIKCIFEDYCRHFGINYSGEVDAEIKCMNHFDNQWKLRNCKGYEIVKELHEQSIKKSFMINKNIFDVLFFESFNEYQQYIYNALKKKESFLNVTYEMTPSLFHSVTVFYSQGNLYCRDTNKKGIIELSSIQNLGIIRDSNLYVRI